MPYQIMFRVVIPFSSFFAFVLSTDFTLAARTGEFKKVEQMLTESWCDVDQVDDNGNTALIIASENGNLKMVDFLLEKKCKNLGNC